MASESKMKLDHAVLLVVCIVRKDPESNIQYPILRHFHFKILLSCIIEIMVRHIRGPLSILIFDSKVIQADNPQVLIL